VSSGGGRTTFRRPSYQRGVGAKRAIPDVAFPASGVYPIIVRGQGLLAGGTSAAAPAWAASWRGSSSTRAGAWVF